MHKGVLLPVEYCSPPLHGLPGWLIVHKIPYLTNDALTDTQIVHELCVQFGVQSALPMPILSSRGEVVGFFEIHNKVGGEFTPDDLDELAFDVDTAIPCGLILNELLTNALKYAFPDGRSGDIHIRRRAEAERVTLSVRDTGIGFPESVDFRNTESFGLQLVGMMTEQLGGTLTLTRQGGTMFTVSIPNSMPQVKEDAQAPHSGCDRGR